MSLYELQVSGVRLPHTRWRGFTIYTDVCGGRMVTTVRCDGAVSSLTLTEMVPIAADGKRDDAFIAFIDAAVEQLWSRWLAL